MSDLTDEIDQARDSLDDAIRAYSKILTDNDDTITTGWVLTVTGMHPERGEVITTETMPGQNFVTTRGLNAVADRYYRGQQR